MLENRACTQVLCQRGARQAGKLGGEGVGDEPLGGKRGGLSWSNWGEKESETKHKGDETFRRRVGGREIYFAQE